MTQQLSPTANAVLTAVTLKRYDVPPEGLPAFAEEMAPLIAAALRAAADQVVPYEEAPRGMSKSVMEYSNREYRRAQRQKTRAALLAIAAELESHD